MPQEGDKHSTTVFYSVNANVFAIVRHEFIEPVFVKDEFFIGEVSLLDEVENPLEIADIHVEDKADYLLFFGQLLIRLTHC